MFEPPPEDFAANTENIIFKICSNEKDKRLSKSDVKEQVQIITNLKPVQS